MTEEDAFLAKILSNPADNLTRLVYADWLEEKADADSMNKSGFLRIDHELWQLPEKDLRGQLLRDELKQRMVSLPISWVVVVARIPIENCGVKFQFSCPRQWNKLQATEVERIRFCDECRKEVHYCRTIAEARQHAIAGGCVAIDSRVVRRESDLQPERRQLMTVGKIAPIALPREPEPPQSRIGRFLRRFRRK